MPTATARRIAIVLISGFGLLSAAAASAQSGDKAPAPPRLELLEEIPAPAATAPASPPPKLTEEERKDGRITSTRVQTGGSTYYVTPNTPPGNAMPGDAQSPGNRPAQWKIFEFNTQPLNEKRRDASAPEPALAAPPTAPPVAPSGPQRR